MRGHHCWTPSWGLDPGEGYAGTKTSEQHYTQMLSMMVTGTANSMRAHSGAQSCAFNCTLMSSKSASN